MHKIGIDRLTEPKPKNPVNRPIFGNRNRGSQLLKPKRNRGKSNFETQTETGGSPTLKPKPKPKVSKS